MGCDQRAMFLVRFLRCMTSSLPIHNQTTQPREVVFIDATSKEDTKRAMRIVKHGRSAGGAFARHVQCLLQGAVSESGTIRGTTPVDQVHFASSSSDSDQVESEDSSVSQAARDACKQGSCPEKTSPVPAKPEGICRKKSPGMLGRSSHRQVHTSIRDKAKEGIGRAPTTEVQKYASPDQYLILNPYSLNGNRQDLKRFLEEVGTDPKEARYWLKQFQSCSESEAELQSRPFAIVQVDSDVFCDKEMMHSLSSALSFLHRHNMKCVVVHGHSANTKLKLQDTKQLLAHDSRVIVSILEHNGAPARPLFVGNGVLQADPGRGSEHPHGAISHVDPGPIQWALLSGHVPVIQSLGESGCGQLVPLQVDDVTAALSKCLKPRKVIFVNTTGGIVDASNEVVANINLPYETDPDFDCSKAIREKLDRIQQLLTTLSPQSSVVITSAGSLLTELFTHHGSGTFFKITEPIAVHCNLDKVDTRKLIALFNRSFGKDLKEDYFDSLQPRFHRLFVTESYSAAAIISIEEGMSVPYLDKFAVSLAKQSEGTGEMLWKRIQKEFKQLFWRSRVTNKINSWYFKKSEGSWSNGEWIVFWYGLPCHRTSSQLIDHALQLHSSFKMTGTGEDNTQVE